MAITIENPEADKLATALANATGLSITDAVIKALHEQLQREGLNTRKTGLASDLLEIGRHCASLPDLDTRTPEQILGYDEFGLPGKW